MKETPLISVIVVNWNGKKWLRKCLSSIFKQTYKNLEVIVVDNASSDDSIEYVRLYFPKVKIIKNKKNLGFSGGNKIGIKSSIGEYIIFLNSDTWIEKNFIEKLFAFYKSAEYDIVAPRERKYDKTKIKNGSSSIDLLGNPAYYAEIASDKSFYLIGLCLFFKKELYNETLGLDEDFFMYFEDVDWFWRLNLLNKNFAYAKDIFVYHSGAGSTGKGLKYNVFFWRNCNMLLMLLKNYSRNMLIIILPIYFTLNLIEILFFLIILKPKIAYSYIQGWIFNLTHLKRTLKKRRWVQAHRVIGDLMIIKNMYIVPTKLVGLLNYFK